MAKGEELAKVAETLAQLASRLTYWNEHSLAYQVRNLSEEITLIAAGLRVKGDGEVRSSIEGLGEE